MLACTNVGKHSERELLRIIYQNIIKDTGNEREALGYLVMMIRDRWRRHKHNLML